jgi:ATP-dependent exoDNAse (exonuclease V) alpha subunit
LNKEKADKLIESINNTIMQKHVFEYIVKFGGSISSAIKIVNRYGQFSLQRLKNNPYEVGMAGSLDFYICDSIAKECGISAYSDMRIQALINEAFNLITQNGDTYTTQSALYETIDSIVKNSFFDVKISKYMILPILCSSENIVIEYDEDNDKNFRIFPKYLYRDEQSILSSIKRLDVKKDLDFDVSYVDEIEIIYDINYEKWQKEAFNLLKTSGIKILTGGPGTGKTTVIDGILKVYNRMYPNKKIVLCAPTGRAAQKMKESTSHEALTIHKVLDYQPYGNEAVYKNALNPINADFIIVDEFSMVDTSLMSILLNAIKPGSLILFVGDIDQLPSVGPGNVMRDLLKSEKIETYHLKTIFRQSENSNIIKNANKINKGNIDLSTGNDFEIYKFNEKKEIIDFLSEYIKKEKDLDLDEFQILSPIKNSIIGVDEINILAQKEFNTKELVLNVSEQMLSIKPLVDVDNIYYRYYKRKDEPPSFIKYDEPFFIDYGIWQFEFFYEKDNEKSRVYKDILKIQTLEMTKKALSKINYGKFEFRKYDKIIMTQNNYEEGYYNGDIGKIVDIHEKYIEVLINNEYKVIKQANWNDMELAYAITIHKSQGSEYNTVVVVLPSDIPKMLKRNLIFTAITRAKNKVIILAESDGLERSILNNQTNIRNTYLYERLVDKKTKILPQIRNDKFTLI